LVWAIGTTLFKVTGWVHKELAFVVAVLFLVHPCQTQAITYISQRFESMATVFYLSTIYCYLQARLSLSRPHQIFLFICSAGFALLGIFTKEVAATIPAMIMAVEWIILKRWSLNLKKTLSWLNYLQLFILGIGFVCLFMKIVGTDFDSIYFRFSASSLSHEGDIVTGGKYVLTQMRVFLTFMRLLILPINQNLDYDYPLSTGLFDPPLTLLGMGLIALMVFLIFRLRRKWPLIAFGLAWILITFSINTAPRIQVIFEHKLYLISFGFFLAAVCALSTIIKDRRILFALLMVLITALSWAGYKRNQVWENQLTMWSDVVQKSPHKARAYNGLGVAYESQGYLVDALSSFNQAIEINPFYEHAYNGRGNVYTKQGRFIQALSDYRKALEIDPGYADVYYNLGILYDKQGNFAQALFDYDLAIKKRSNYPEAYYNRGNTYRNINNFSQALSDYNKALEQDPDYEKAYINRGNIYSRQGRFVQAMSDYNKAVTLDPGDAQVYIDRGTCYAEQRDYPGALLDYGRAIAIDPYDAEAYYDRAVTYYQLKEYNKAREDVDKAGSLGARINPRFLEDLKKQV
jgi:tetratricopeptide (TPR) repeat protein